MASKSFLISLLASSLPLILAAPTASPNRDGVNHLFKARAETCPGFESSPAPIHYTGPASNFPDISVWVDYETMFSANQNTMIAAGSSSDDVGRIDVAIQSASQTIGIDPRVILGIIMEESHGYVGVASTVNADGSVTAGLMQSSNCPGFPGQNELSQDDTSSMINCGSEHYKLNLEDFGDLLAGSSIYPALREYNTGSVSDPSDLSDAPNCIGNPFYVSDIANRFLGNVF